MNKIAFIVVILLGFLTLSESQAQRRWKNDSGERPRPEQLDKYRKMRLVEVMNLGEEEAIRFFAKEDAHREKIRQIMKERNNVLDELDKKINEKKDPTELNEDIKKIQDIDQQVVAERKRYHEELKAFLNTKQYARFLLFERNFGNRLRDAFDELHKESGDRPR